MSRRKLIVKSGLFDTYSPAPDEVGLGEDDPHHNITKMGTLHSDDLLRLKYTFIFANAMLGVLLMIIELQVAWDGEALVWTKGAGTLRFLITFLTILLIVQLLDYYNTLLSVMTKPWKEARGNLGFNISGWSVLQSSLVAPYFWAEALICIIHAPPFRSIDDKVGVLMFLRFYMVFRIVRDYSVMYQFRRAIMRKYAKYGKRWGPPRFTWGIAAKTLLYRYPFATIFTLIMWTLWVCGHCIYVFEREADPELYTYYGSFYLALISMITGWPTDTYEMYWPNTRFGRMSCIMSTMIGLFLLTLMLEVLSSYATATPHQRPAMLWCHRHDIKMQLRDSAARIIQLVWKKYSIESHKRANFLSEKRRCTLYRQSLGARYVQAVKDFRNLMRQKIALQVRFDESQSKDLIDGDETPHGNLPYSDEDSSYGAENTGTGTGHAELEERLRAMETLIQTLNGKIDTLVGKAKKSNLKEPDKGEGGAGPGTEAF